MPTPCRESLPLATPRCRRQRGSNAPERICRVRRGGSQRRTAPHTGQVTRTFERRLPFRCSTATVSVQSTAGWVGRCGESDRSLPIRRSRRQSPVKTPRFIRQRTSLAGRIVVAPQTGQVTQTRAAPRPLVSVPQSTAGCGGAADSRICLACCWPSRRQSPVKTPRLMNDRTPLAGRIFAARQTGQVTQTKAAPGPLVSVPQSTAGCAG